jgi:hypothetical protein
MKLYSCKVRLSGSLYNEVRKTDVTAAEIHVLRVLHGSDAVVEVFETGKNKMAQTGERDRIVFNYGPGLAAHRQLRETAEQAVNGLFGIGQRLPEEIQGAPKAPPMAAKAAPVAEPEDDPGEPEENPEA